MSLGRHRLWPSSTQTWKYWSLTLGQGNYSVRNVSLAYKIVFLTPNYWETQIFFCFLFFNIYFYFDKIYSVVKFLTTYLMFNTTTVRILLCTDHGAASVKWSGKTAFQSQSLYECVLVENSRNKKCRHYIERCSNINLWILLQNWIYFNELPSHYILSLKL